MSELPSGEAKIERALDDDAISELIRFFRLLDKWNREARVEAAEDGFRECRDREGR